VGYGKILLLEIKTLDVDDIADIERWIQEMEALREEVRSLLINQLYIEKREIKYLTKQ
jgi:hypothetical protein